MAAVAKFPAALLQLLADMGGTMPGRPNTELTLNADVLLATVVPFSLVVNEAIPAAWDQVGYLTVESEVLHHSAYNAGTKTFTIDARAQDGTVAALHSAGVRVGKWLTAVQWNQIVADVIALETQLLGGMLNPNQFLNYDFGRRTVFALAMPVTFADGNGYAQLDGGAAPTVAGNALTQAAVNNEVAWPKSGVFWWPNGRRSAQFKMVATAGVYQLRGHYVDANNYIRCLYNNGNFTLSKVVAGVNTDLSTVAQAGTLNNRFWLELDLQRGTGNNVTVTARIYNSGAAPAAKPATALQTLTATIADAAFIAAGRVTVTSDQATTVWGEMAASPGGVYVETWLPESFTYTFAGTLDGQAIGYDESVDAGPNVIGAPYKQWAMRYYEPASTRGLRLEQDLPDGSIAATTAYAGSAYMKVAGFGGAGTLCEIDIRDTNSALGATHDIAILTDGGAVAWTRRTGTATTAGTSRRAYVQINLGGALVGGTATGTAYFMLPQLEQGSAATAPRAAPADDGGIQIEQVLTGSPATTVNVYAEVDPRDLALNLFLPWDAIVGIDFSADHRNAVATNYNRFTLSVDGAQLSTYGILEHMPNNGYDQHVHLRRTQKLAAGPHRITVLFATQGGTMTVGSFSPSSLSVLATRGR